MKASILTLLLATCSLFSLAQDDTYPRQPNTSKKQEIASHDAIKLEGGQIFFERVYDVPGADSKTIETMLLTSIPRVKDLSEFSKTGEVITAKIKNCIVDYKKYGGKWANTAVFLNHPFFCNVTAEWKEGRYRITLTGMEWHTAGLGLITATEAFTAWAKGEEFDNSKISQRAMSYVDQYFTDLFIAKKSKSDW